MDTATNPLLNFEGLPLFDEIEPKHVEPALDYMLEHNRNQIDKLTSSKVQPTWENFIEPLEELSDRLDRMWAPVSHLNGVRDSTQLRKSYEACLPKLTEYASRMGQDRALFQKMLDINNSREFSQFDQARKKSIENEVRDFRLSGVDLDEDDQKRYREISNRLSELGNIFSQNLLDATDAWQMRVTEKDQLTGIPDIVVETAAASARNDNREGWLFTLQAPSYIPVMTYAESRELRREMYHAYVTRASELGEGEWDNAGIICETIQLRTEIARLLEFENYAEYSLQTKMAESPVEVAEFLRDLARRSRDTALADVRELEDFARQECSLDTLEPWDYAWASEKLKISKYDVSGEALRPYFPLPAVLKGMFDIVNRLFGINVREVPLAQRWHECVQYFEITDHSGELRGHFYIDLYAREHKRGGAWMAECMGRMRTSNLSQLPVAFLTCNFPSPAGDRPSLLNHDEVMTIFHEFGHGLHHLLTRVEVASVAGINGVPWDAVELPSQFLENWCWEREALDLISGHYQTGEKIPDDLFLKLREARNFQSAMQMLRQVEFSLFDLELHRLAEAPLNPGQVRNLLNEIRSEVAVVRTPDFNRFENSFGHIFAGGYAAGYYSYKWAEVLSADAFGLFEKNGLFHRETGQSFLENILEKGGSEDPADLFARFRGRKPRVNALLRHSGLSSGDEPA